MMTARDLIAEYGAHLRICQECDAAKQHYCDEALEIIERLYEGDKKALSRASAPVRTMSARAS